MRTEQFLRDYFTEDEHFIIALKTLPAAKDKKAYTTHKLLNIKDPNLSKFLGHCYYKNRDEAVDIYFTLNSYQEQSTNIKRVESLVNGVKSFYFDIDKEVELLYRLIRRGTQWKIFDVNIEGEWWTDSFKNQFNHIITTKSYDELISAMKKKLGNVQAGTSF